jgi:chemotaxis protein histidine kinase CheA
MSDQDQTDPNQDQTDPNQDQTNTDDSGQMDQTTPDDAANTSIWSNLKNKVTYNVHQATYDPNANQFAQKRQAAQQAQQQQQQQQQQTQAESTDSGDPNTFSAKRFLNQINQQIISISKQVVVPFFALIMAMIIANEMIVYSAPIRIIFFIFIFFICFTSPVILTILAVYYILKGGYSYYYNNMTGRPKKIFLPTIFTLLPISKTQPMSTLGRFFMYPFTYPKSERGIEQLREIVDDYGKNLKESFKAIEKLKSEEPFTTNLKFIQDYLNNLKGIPSRPQNPMNVANNVVKTATNAIKSAAGTSPSAPSAPPAPPAPSTPSTPSTPVNNDISSSIMNADTAASTAVSSASRAIEASGLSAA